MPPAVLQAESEARQAAIAQLAEQRKDAAAAERQLRAYYEGRLRERNRELAAARMHVQVQLLVGLGAVEGVVWCCACVGAGCCQTAPAWKGWCVDFSEQAAASLRLQVCCPQWGGHDHSGCLCGCNLAVKLPCGASCTISLGFKASAQHLNPDDSVLRVQYK